MAMSISTTAFKPGQKIPRKHTGEGEDVSPPLSWSGVPGGTAEFALIVDDPDAPTTEPWVHWVIYKVPGGSTGLPENVSKVATLPEPAGALQGRNSWDRVGYGGPMPPPGHGTHHYYFKLYALDRALPVSAGLTKTELLRAMQGHILAGAELVGIYER